VRIVTLTLATAIGSGSAAHAQPPVVNSTKGTAAWTIAGAGGGFGIGLWAGLTKFDDSINSERKVWTTAIVGAAVGAVSGYLIACSRASRSRPPSPSLVRPVRPTPPIVWPRDIGAARNVVAGPTNVS
jgi:hypothetical protein